MRGSGGKKMTSGRERRLKREADGTRWRIRGQGRERENSTLVVGERPPVDRL